MNIATAILLVVATAIATYIMVSATGSPRPRGKPGSRLAVILYALRNIDFIKSVIPVLVVVGFTAFILHRIRQIQTTPDVPISQGESSADSQLPASPRSASSARRPVVQTRLTSQQIGEVRRHFSQSPLKHGWESPEWYRNGGAMTRELDRLADPPVAFVDNFGYAQQVRCRVKKGDGTLGSVFEYAIELRTDPREDGTDVSHVMPNGRTVIFIETCYP